MKTALQGVCVRFLCGRLARSFRVSYSAVRIGRFWRCFGLPKDFRRPLFRFFPGFLPIAYGARRIFIVLNDAPIAQRRLTRMDDHHVQYLAKDTKNRRLTPVIYSNQDFVRLLMPHVNDRYVNSMRYFGLLAPRSKVLLTCVFSVLEQQQRPRPTRLGYAESMHRTFGQNPLIGLDGQRLLRVGHIKPLAPKAETNSKTRSGIQSGFARI